MARWAALVALVVPFVLACQAGDPPSTSSETATAPTLEIRPTVTPHPARTTAVVVSVTDGDTIRVNIDGVVRPLRYIGMDTAETVAPGQPVGCFGREATARNKALVEGRVVELEKDVSETDRFNRLLRYVYVDGQMVNETMVLEGYAQAVTYPPDVKYQDRLRAAEVEAREAGRGFWSDCAD